MDPFGGFEWTFAMAQGLFFLVFAVVAIGIVVAVVRQFGHSARNAASPEVTAVAAVVDKRIETHGGGEMQVSQRHFVSFEQPGGERFELEVPAAEYGLLVAGDRGTVTMKGSRYLGFARELMR